jgi:hypothetical protein
MVPRADAATVSESMPLTDDTVPSRLEPVSVEAPPETMFRQDEPAPDVDAAAVPATFELETFAPTSDVSAGAEPVATDAWPGEQELTASADAPHVVELAAEDLAAGASAFASEQVEAVADARAAAVDDWEIVVELDETDFTTAETAQPMPAGAMFGAGTGTEAASEHEQELVDAPLPAVAAVAPTPAVVVARHDRFDAADEARSADDAALIDDLMMAADTPSLRFQAAAQLGRIYMQRGDLRRGIQWLEHACGVAAPVRDHGLTARYELAAALERAGDVARAIEVLSDLEMDAGSYRDVSSRLSRLSQLTLSAP